MEVMELVGFVTGHNIHFPTPIQHSPDQQVAEADPLASMALIWMHTQEILRAGLLAQLSGSPPVPATKGPPNVLHA